MSFFAYIRCSECLMKLFKQYLSMTFLIVFLTMFNPTFSQTFQIYNGDTINLVDANNMKQGHWIYFGNMKSLPGFAPDAKVEEGEFTNNRKNGTWIKYYPDGKTQSEITFMNNRPSGPYKTYYKNGQIEEEGVWKNNRNVGHFTRYYENGEKQQDFNFGTTGKREGHQEYYYENGQTMIEGNWATGKEDGKITEYFADGSLKSEKYFNGGALDPAKTVKYEPKNEIKEVLPEPKETKEAPEVTKEEKVLGSNKVSTNKNLGFFDGNGQNTLYNKNKQISQSGVFKNGRLWDGKWYRYDEDGILEAIEIYKNGKYVGDGVIEE